MEDLEKDWSILRDAEAIAFRKRDAPGRNTKSVAKVVNDLQFNRLQIVRETFQDLVNMNWDVGAHADYGQEFLEELWSCFAGKPHTKQVLEDMFGVLRDLQRKSRTKLISLWRRVLMHTSRAGQVLATRASIQKKTFLKLMLRVRETVW